LSRFVVNRDTVAKQKKWASETERKRAYRARKKAEADKANVVKPEVPVQLVAQGAPAPKHERINRPGRCPMLSPVGTICKFCGKVHELPS